VASREVKIRGILDVATHTSEQFIRIVDALNKMFDGWLTFQLVGSLKEKPASYHDADIVVYPLPNMPPGIDLQGFIRGCKKAGVEIMQIDRDSRTPFPGRPDGQDRIQLKFTTGQVVDLFFPKGKNE
jgi:hypothetical protein